MKRDDAWLRRVDEVFLDAADLEEPDRSHYLDSACSGDAEIRAEVDSLLLADATGPAILECDLSSMPTAAVDQAHPTRVERYRVREVLGHGAMGVVYLAEEDDASNRRVAL